MNRSQGIHAVGAALLLAATLGVASPVDAAVVVTAVQTGGNVVFTGSGTLDVSGISNDGNVVALPSPGISPVGGSGPRLTLGALASSVDVYGTGQVSTPAPYGTTNTAGVGAGDYFGISEFVSGPVGIGVPTGYVSGDPLSGTLTFAGSDFATLGLLEGTYVWSWGSGQNADTLTLRIIPEPASLALLGLGAALLATRRRI